MPDTSEKGFIPIDNTVMKEVLAGSSFSFAIYEAEHTEVILGRSNKKEEEVFVHNCIKDNVPILRRAGGGGSVVLSKGVFIISIAGKSPLPYHLREHLNSVNRSIIHTLESFHIERLSIKGISDIALGNKKILGSSLYRKRDIVLYQGALLANPDLTLIERYLKHPKREPDYRKGRMHREFITSLYNEGYKIDKPILIAALQEEFQHRYPWIPDNSA